VDTVTGGAFDSCCSTRFHLLDWVVLICPLSREMHPAVERGCPFFAAGTRFDAHRVRDFPDRIAKTYLLIFDKPGEANAMRLALDFAYWCILFLGVHGSLVSTVYPFASMTW
jgi:hypothetical protein